MQSIIVRTADRDYEVKTFKFPGGELQVEVVDFPKVLNDHVVVITRIQSSDDLVQLILVKQVIDQTTNVESKGLVLPYFPYARQDRIAENNQAFSLRAMTDLINHLNFDQVTVVDPHSDVTAALLDNVEVVDQVDVVLKHDTLRFWLSQSSSLLVSPDAGSSKKAERIAKALNKSVITAGKTRNFQTGEITGTVIHNPEMITPNSDLIIVDDICDGGRTFIELAKTLKAHNPRSISLYVTHGIFSKGFEVFDGLITQIFTTDSFNHDQTSKNIPVYSKCLAFDYLGTMS